jgi:hypothetical protein
MARRRVRARPDIGDERADSPDPVAAASPAAQVLRLQRSAGNAAVAGALARKGPAPAPARAPPAGFADRKALVARLVTGAPSADDLAAACRFLSPLPVADVLAIAREIKAGRAASLTALRDRAAADDRLEVALDAVLLEGRIGRLAFADEHTQELVPLEASNPADVKRILDVLGPAVREVEELIRCKGYLALTGEERARLYFLVGGSTSLSAKAPRALRAVLDDPRQDKDDPATFRRFLGDGKFLQDHVQLPGGKRQPRDPFTVTAGVEVADHPFHSGAAPARAHSVEVEGKDQAGTDVTTRIGVFAPTERVAERGVGLPTVQEVAEVLAETPHVSRSKIVRVDLNPKRSPDDAKWRANPNYNPGGGDFRTYMSAGSVGIVSIYPASDPHDQLGIASSLLHETGHTASRAAWGNPHDLANKRWDPWRDAIKSDGMALSTYGKSSTSEDFAESWALYAAAVGKPREREIRRLIPARCRLMDTLLNQRPGPQP